jgi:hypothetical protein
MPDHTHSSQLNSIRLVGHCRIGSLLQLNQLKETGLIENCQRAGFLRMDSGSGRQVLTGNGSWFINEMLNQLKRVI